MAGIDKIYLKTRREFIQFYEWCEMFDDFCIKETNDSIIDCFYYRPHMIEDNQTEYIATNTSCKIDEWLWKHCPLPFIRDYMKKMWGYEYKNKSKWLFYIDRSFDREKFRQQRTLNSLWSEVTNEYVQYDDKIIMYKIFNKILDGECRYKFIKELSKIYRGQLIY